MRAILAGVLDRLPYLGRLRAEVSDLQDGVDAAGLFPAGHFYSPIPSAEEVAAELERLASARGDGRPPKGIDLDGEGQFALLKAVRQYYPELPFPDVQGATCRYYYANQFFRHTDAIVLYGFLRHTRPHRIVEVGSGFSSAVMLDAAERCDAPPMMTFIDPYPDRLLGLLTEQDQKTSQVLRARVQDVPASTFGALESGDLLFIDSSHVVKCGSDVHFLLFDVLPKLAPGVFVHFHDIFYPFDYPAGWLDEGRFWNEAYFLRAFLMHNQAWQIRIFNSYVSRVHRDYITKEMPLCVNNPGGSIYLQKLA